LVISRKEPNRRREIPIGTRRAREVVQKTALLVAEGPKLRGHSLKRRSNARRHLAGELGDIRDRDGTERGEASQHQGLERVSFGWPFAVCDPMSRGGVWRGGAGAMPVGARRGRDEV